MILASSPVLHLEKNGDIVLTTTGVAVIFIMLIIICALITGIRR